MTVTIKTATGQSMTLSSVELITWYPECGEKCDEQPYASGASIVVNHEKEEKK